MSFDSLLNKEEEKKRRGTWEDWNSLSSVIHVFAGSWIWHSYLSMLHIAQWTQQHSPGLEGPNKRHWSLSSPAAAFCGFRCFLSAQFLPIVQPEDQFETHRLQEGILAKREIWIRNREINSHRHRLGTCLGRWGWGVAPQQWLPEWRECA